MTLSDGTGYAAHVGGSSYCQEALNKRLIFIVRNGGLKGGTAKPPTRKSQIGGAWARNADMMQEGDFSAHYCNSFQRKAIH